MKKVGIIGCGAILKRHIESIEKNSDFKLQALCDIDPLISKNSGKKYSVNYYQDFKKLIINEDVNFIVIATPNSLHVEQAEYALMNGCDVLIEKPISLDYKDVYKLTTTAEKFNQKAYCVLQVRENPSIQLCKKVLELGLLGNIRGISLVQRWQRPLEYFTGWRAIPHVGGGTLYECGIHYIDIMCYLLNKKPNSISSKVYSIKHKDVDIEDTVYSILDFKDYGGTLEITIASEPTNLECSLSILGSNGFLKIGGKAMNIIESANFLSNGARVQYQNLVDNSKIPNKPNSYGSYQGSCPNHPDLYKNIDKYNILESLPAIELIDQIYKQSDVKYY